jgi:hypothetical protein
MRLQTSIAVLSLCVLVAPFAVAKDVTIQLAHNSAREQQAKAQLERLLGQYDVSKYIFTEIIEDRAIPHSHPVLTLNTRHLNDDDAALSTFLHEQIHWFLEARPQQTEELKAWYPNPPVGPPDGAQDLESDYLHLIVCELEREADLKLLGAERPQAVMSFWAGDHYKWVYKTVIADHERIQALIQRHNLEIR